MDYCSTPRMALLSKSLKLLSPDKHYLLGFSGGPDSMALFLLLKRHGISFEAMHIDHQWRPLSKQEAESLQHFSEEQHVPFHLVTLPKPSLTNNLEERYRQMRLAAFAKCYAENQFDALLLGHQADDRAETTLKRIFEGAFLWNLKGVAPIQEMQGMRIIRPLLHISKATLMQWLKREGAFWIEDYTNEDLTFLRPRLRQEIIPHLSKVFGKEVMPALCQVAEQALELQEYLDQRTASIIIEESATGWSFQKKGIPAFEVKYLLKKHLKSSCSKEQLAQLVKAHKLHLVLEKEEIFVAKGILKVVVR